MVKQETPILELIKQGREDITRTKEKRREIFNLVDEMIKLGEYKKAEEILGNDLYDLDFNKYQRSLERYKELRNLSDFSDKIFSDYLKILLEERGNLMNFDKIISPLISRVRKFGEGS